MNKLVIFILLLIGSTIADNMHFQIMDSFADKSIKEQFKVWHFISNKAEKYEINTEEGIRRYINFKANFKYVKKVNAKNLSYKLGLGEFADMTFPEFKKIYLVMDWKKYQRSMRFLGLTKSFDEMADEIDRKDGDYTSTGVQGTTPDWATKYDGVRNQGGCGSCWSFATAGTVEGWFSIRDKKYRMFSTQQLVSCDTRQWGCNGGHPYYSGKYEKETGLVLESEYPYTSGNGMRGACNASKMSGKKYKISNSRYCEAETDWESMKCTANEMHEKMHLGPVYVGVEANQDLMMYRDGVWDGACNYGPNHAVVAVQMTDGDFKIRNSWGANWGKGGYFRVKRSRSNNMTCFVESSAWYPTL
ncbi:MAG: C1 family peptidase [PVC group bacterium]|nr:C1 family peptidase [PVC group bacterium]